MPEYVVDITKDWARIGSGMGHRRFSITPEWCGPGSWTAAWPLEHEDAREMLDAIAAGDDARRWGVALVERGSSEPAVAGFCTSITLVDGQVSGFDANSIVASGFTDTAVLAGALSYPNPAVDSATTIHTRTPYVDGGWPNAETAILDLIRENLGGDAVVRRELAAITVPSSLNRGGAVNYARRFPTLLEAVREICLTANLSVRVDRVPGGLAVVVSEQERRPDIRWSRLSGTLAGAAVTYGSDGATSVIVGGKRTDNDDELTRQFVRVDKAAPAGGYAYPREVFRDATGSETLAELQQDGLEELTERAGVPSVEITPAANSPWPYGPGSLLVGDLTVVDVGAGPIATKSPEVRVESVTISRSSSGAWLAVPSLGPPRGDPTAVQRRLYNDLSRMKKR